MPEDLHETAELFRYFEQQKAQTLSNVKFDDEVLGKVRRPEGKSISMFNYARIAAGIAIFLVISFYCSHQHLYYRWLII